jgi:hypothetical protein
MVLYEEPLPLERRLRFKYAEQVQLDAGTGSIDTYLFRTNSLYDPDQTGTGHQPYTYDQWASMYSRSAVVRSRIKVVFQTGDTTLAGGFPTVGIQVIRATGDAPVDQTTILESSHVKWRQMGAIYGGPSAVVTVNESWDARAWLRTDPMTTRDYTENISGSAVSVANFFCVFAAAGYSTADPGIVRANVFIEYDAVLFEPIAPSGS